MRVFCRSCRSSRFTVYEQTGPLAFCCTVLSVVRQADQGLPGEEGLTGSPRLAIFASTNMKQDTAANRVDLMFRAFSDRNRLRILHLLQDGEMCVGDIVDVLQVPQSRVSRHLAYLRRAKLVVARKEGLWSFYSLAPSENQFHKNLLDCLGKCFGDVPEIKADAARAGKVRKAGGCCPK